MVNMRKSSLIVHTKKSKHTQKNALYPCACGKLAV